MIEGVEVTDIPEIHSLIERAVRTSVARTPADLDFLIPDIGSSFSWWGKNRDQSCHLKYMYGDSIAGVILVKNYWNLCNLFVDPEHYRSGIGRALFEAAVEVSRQHPEVESIKVYSSSFATGFYEAMGFKKLGPGIDRPGGSIPYEFGL